MTKSAVDTLIKNMQKAGIVSKAAPWLMEAHGEKEFHVRYVGLRLAQDWEDIFSLSNNLLMKFLVHRQDSYAELYLANKPPFLKLLNLLLAPETKWEAILGETKRRLHKDKEDYLKHLDQIDNLYVKIKPHLK